MKAVANAARSFAGRPVHCAGHGERLADKRADGGLQFGKSLLLEDMGNEYWL